MNRNHIILLTLTVCFCTANTIAGELFPTGKFDWLVEKCEIKESIKDGKYRCGLFLDTGKEKKRFFFWYNDTKPNMGEWKPCIGLDTQNTLRAAKASMKVDFSRIDPKALHRMSFLVKPTITMEQGKEYEAVVYIKTDMADQNIRISLMGNYNKVGRTKEHGIYKFVSYNTSTMWRPYKVRLSRNIRTDVDKAIIKHIAVQADSPCVLWIGQISLREVAPAKQDNKDKK